MAISFSIAKLLNPLRPNDPAKYYARAQSQKVISCRDLSTEISWGTSLTPGDMYNAINSAAECISRHLRTGNAVDMGDFGKFYCQLSSEGTDTIEEFTRHKIKKVSFRFRPGMLIREALNDIRFEQVISLKAKAEAKRKFIEEDKA